MTSLWYCRCVSNYLNFIFSAYIKTDPQYNLDYAFLMWILQKTLSSNVQPAAFVRNSFLYIYHVIVFVTEIKKSLQQFVVHKRMIQNWL